MTGNRTNLSGKRVLVVEDEYYLADDLSRALSQVGAAVVGPVATIAEAEEKVTEGAFNLAVIDMNLHGEFTCAIAEKLKRAGIPFILATGYNQSSLPELLADVPRLEKPFSPQQAVELLTRLVPNSLGRD